MEQGKLSQAQVDVLRALAGAVPGWRLSGGAALAGFHTRNRPTRDLDLFWRRGDLERVDAEVARRLHGAGFATQVVQRDPAFCRLRVSRGTEVVLVDLIADPVATVAEPTEQPLGDAVILVDSPHEILVTKLCTLLSRSELRDLEDVQVLLRAGGDLGRALFDAPRKDAGFSPITLAWVLEKLPVLAMGGALGRQADETRKLERFRAELVAAVLAAAKPA